MMFGCYFFLSESKVLQSKMLANIVDVIVNLEGIAALVFLFLMVVPQMINARQLEAKSIRTLFFDYDEMESKDPERRSSFVMKNSKF